MFVALFSIRYLIRYLGADRFGVLSLALVVIGYASFLDLGVGRALTQLVSEKITTGHRGDLSRLIWTSWAVLLVQGGLGALAFALLSPVMVHRFLKIPLNLQPEALRAFYLLAVSVPVIIMSAGLRAILEACQEFRLANAVRAPLGVFTYLGPLAAIWFSRSLVPVIAVLIFGRIVAAVVYLVLALRVLPELNRGIDLDRSVLGRLLRLGGWITVSALLGSVVITIDRLLVGARVSAEAVTYYATPNEVVTKLWLVSSALAGVLFPAFAASFAQDRARASSLFARGVKFTIIALFPISLLIILFAREGLRLWLGPVFSATSSAITQWMTVGVFLLGVEVVPYTLLQGIGRPDAVAKIQFLEVPFYVLALWFLTGAYGIEGTAIAFLLRSLIDTVAVFIVACRLGKRVIPDNRLLWDTLFAAAVLLGAGFVPDRIGLKSIVSLLLLAAFAIFCWIELLDAADKQVIAGWIKLTEI